MGTHWVPMAQLLFKWKNYWGSKKEKNVKKTILTFKHGSKESWAHEAVKQLTSEEESLGTSYR